MTSNRSSTSSIPVWVAIVVTQLLLIFSVSLGWVKGEVDDNVEFGADIGLMQLIKLEETPHVDVEGKLLSLFKLFSRAFGRDVCNATDVEVEVEFLVGCWLFEKCMFKEKEEYEKCAVCKLKIDNVNKILEKY